MSTELTYLSASVALYLIMVLYQDFLNFGDHSLSELVGSRDGLIDKSVKLARAKRAVYNMIQAMIMFIPLVLIAVIAGRTNQMTAMGAAIFFWARAAYAPAYWLGIPWLRSIVWVVSLIGLVMIFLQVLPFSLGVS